MLLIEAPGDVQAPAMALVTQVKANLVWAVLALVAMPSDGVQPTCIAPYPAVMVSPLNIDPSSTDYMLPELSLHYS